MRFFLFLFSLFLFSHSSEASNPASKPDIVHETDPSRSISIDSKNSPNPALSADRKFALPKTHPYAIWDSIKQLGSDLWFGSGESVTADVGNETDLPSESSVPKEAPNPALSADRRLELPKTHPYAIWDSIKQLESDLWSGSGEPVTADVGSGTGLSSESYAPKGAPNSDLAENSKITLNANGETLVIDNPDNADHADDWIPISDVKELNLGPDGATLKLVGPISTDLDWLITGSGKLTVASSTGNGILTLWANSFYSGPTHIESATLAQGVENAFSPKSDYFLASRATLDTNGFNATIGALSGEVGSKVTNSGDAATLSIGATNKNGVFKGTIQDGGRPLSIIKVGVGTQVLEGDNTFTGKTVVREGGLIVHGKLASPHILIQPNGTLGGIGTLAGHLVNSGKVSPGNSIGTLTVNGNYTQTADGNLLIQLSENGNVLLAVGGSAKLDGTLSVEASPESSGEGGLILTAKEGIKDAFSKINSSEDLLVHAIYEPTDVWLVVLGVGKPMRMISLEKLTPQIVGNVKDILFNSTNTQYGQLTTRLATIRTGVNSVTLQGLSQEPMTEQYNKRGLYQGGQKIAYVNEELHWDVWASASGIFSNINNASDLPNINLTTGYFGAGADYRINQNFNLGIYTGYQGSQVRYSNGSLKSNGVKFGLYGTSQWNGFYVNGIVGAGTHAMNLKYSPEYADRRWSTSGKPFTAELDSLLGFGYEHRWNSWTFGINNSMQYTYVGISSFTQNVAQASDLNMRIGRQNPSSLVYTLGGNISYLWKIAPNYHILPTVGAYWQHEFLNNGQRISSQFANGMGVPFYFNSRAGARNNAFGVAGITTQIGPRLGTFAYYTPQVGGGQIYSNSILMGLNFKF